MATPQCICTWLILCRSVWQPDPYHHLCRFQLSAFSCQSFCLRLNISICRSGGVGSASRKMFPFLIACRTSCMSKRFSCIRCLRWAVGIILPLIILSASALEYLFSILEPHDKINIMLICCQAVWFYNHWLLIRTSAVAPGSKEKGGRSSECSFWCTKKNRIGIV